MLLKHIIKLPHNDHIYISVNFIHTIFAAFAKSMHPPSYPVALASAYTTQMAEGLCPINFVIVVQPKLDLLSGLWGNMQGLAPVILTV